VGCWVLCWSLVPVVVCCSGDYSSSVISNFQIVCCVDMAGYCSPPSCLRGRVSSSAWMGITQDLLSFSSPRRVLPDYGFATCEYMCGKGFWKSVWYMVCMGLLGMYSHVCQSAVAGRETLCKIYPSSLGIFLVGLRLNSLCRVDTMLIIDQLIPGSVKMFSCL
jgi:hypothetical protein